MTVTLEESYAHCRQLNKRYGTTYYWASLTLPAVKRHHVWAVYGFCRHADDIVDELTDRPVSERAAALAALGDRLRSALDGASVDPTADPVVAAVACTAIERRIDPECFDRFLRSPVMVKALQQLLGESIRLHGSKLNLKSPRYGSPASRPASME